MPSTSTTGRLGSTDCERLRPGPMAQPVNTVTSAAFVAGAAAVAARARTGRLDAGTGPLAFASLLALVGLGSMAFHGPQPPGAKRLHDWPIAGLLALTASTPLVRAARGRRALPGWSRRRGTALGTIAAAGAATYAAGRTTAPTCRPDSVIQPHGAWHVLAATGFVACAEILYASEGLNGDGSGSR